MKMKCRFVVCALESLCLRTAIYSVLTTSLVGHFAGSHPLVRRHAFKFVLL